MMHNLSAGAKAGLDALKEEIRPLPAGCRYMANIYQARGYREHFAAPVPVARAHAAAALFTEGKKHIYPHDRIAGAIRGAFSPLDEVSAAESDWADALVANYGTMHFGLNFDHFAPDYEGFLADGVEGTIERIRRSAALHRSDADSRKKLDFLHAAEVAMRGFGQMIGQYADAAQAAADAADDPACAEELSRVAAACRRLQTQPPATFREALQLVWLCYCAFVLEGRAAMAFGRMDQYLYPYYQRDVAAGRLTDDDARSLLASAFIKIVEAGHSDICNIAIGGLRPDGTGGVNELSYIILGAVKDCNVPGPNLSARLYPDAPDEFLDACLQVIGTGLGYPALMNDAVNIPALHRLGYTLADSRNYCMVGCIENFIQGKQPPWTDGRYNSPKFLELALNNGVCMQTGLPLGPQTGDPAAFSSMDDVLRAVHRQMVAGADEYMARFDNENGRYDRVHYTQPFLSCFCRCCIDRGLDINDGGALYPSVHGAGCMGIATVADSLAAIERVVFTDKKATMAELRQALLDDFTGHEALHAALLAAPKYGNNDDFVDKYAVWFVREHERVFADRHTRDGGAVYIGIASNVDNIPAGKLVAATPDGRKNGQPVSDAASPAHGMDRRGPTSVVLSTTKPDFSLASCGTVLNQKYTPATFSDPEKRKKLLQLIRVYFAGGGQEMQINAVSRGVLQDAMAHPDDYRSLVVRVSGFSAFYTSLDRSVQEDILERTEHG